MRHRMLLAALAIITAIILFVAYMWWTDGGSRVAAPARQPEGAQATAVGSTLMLTALAFCAGVLGGMIGGHFGSRTGDRSRRLVDERLRELERWRDSSRVQRDNLAAQKAQVAPETPSMAQPRPSDVDRVREPSQRAPAESREGPSAVRAIPPLHTIVAEYGTVASGQLSRTRFQEFFDSIGRSGPVEAVDGGQSIESSRNDEAFLTSVHSGNSFLVFPSYDFVANQATQFTTIASVPEGVAAIFELTRGTGDFILDRPAIFEDGEFGLRLVSRGEIRGFGG